MHQIDATSANIIKVFCLKYVLFVLWKSVDMQAIFYSRDLKFHTFLFEFTRSNSDKHEIVFITRKCMIANNWRFTIRFGHYNTERVNSFIHGSATY